MVTLLWENMLTLCFFYVADYQVFKKYLLKLC